jgi:DNA modification methylase
MDRIITGDALTMLRTLKDGFIQTCITSPPYFGLRDYGVEGQIGLEISPDEYVARLVEVFREVRRVLREDGTLWLNLGDTYANDTKWGGTTGGKHVKELHGDNAARHRRHTGLKPKDLIGIPWMVAFALRADGWYLRSDIIWNKPNTMPESVEDRPTKSHEYLFLFAKNERYYYDSEAIREPAIKGDAHAGARNYAWQPDKGRLRFSQTESDRAIGRNKRSVWTISTQSYEEAHFATFPPKLIEPCILAGSRPGDIVLDPFIGAGTTALVAIGHGRHYLGVELNPEYVTLAEKRIHHVQQNLWTVEGIA